MLARQSVEHLSGHDAPDYIEFEHLGSGTMSPYKVMVDDNFHYMEEDERWEYGTFASAEEALDACRRLVDEALMAEYRDGATAEQLFVRYTSFGDDPFIVALDDAEKVFLRVGLCPTARVGAHHGRAGGRGAAPGRARRQTPATPALTIVSARIS